MTAIAALSANERLVATARCSGRATFWSATGRLATRFAVDGPASDGGGHGGRVVGGPRGPGLASTGRPRRGGREGGQVDLARWGSLVHGEGEHGGRVARVERHAYGRDRLRAGCIRGNPQSAVGHGRR